MQIAEAQQPLFPPAIMKALQRSVQGLLQGRTYHFISSDSKWKLAIATDFLALSTIGYKRWEEFRLELETALDAFVRIYEPSFFVRVGLRYRDVIKKSVEPLKGLDWPQILQPHIFGELGPEEVRNSIQHAAREVLISLGETRGQVRILHGLIREAGDKDFSYSIDSDFFSEERTEITNAFELLDAYHREAGRLFRWFTTSTVHERLGPTNLS